MVNIGNLNFISFQTFKIHGYNFLKGNDSNPIGSMTTKRHVFPRKINKMFSKVI